MQEDMNKLAFDLYHPYTLQKQNYDLLTLSSTRETSQSHCPWFPISTAYNSHQISHYLATTSGFHENQHQTALEKLWYAQCRNGYTVQPSNQCSIATMCLNRQHRLMASSTMSINNHHNMMNRQELQRLRFIYEDTRHRFNNYSAANSREDALLYS
ncbi:unnamed protein product [Cochlearia groenlandica]